MEKYSYKDYFKCYWGFIKPYLGRQVIGFFCVLLSTLLGLTSPLLMKYLLDFALVDKSMELVYIILAISLGVLVAQNTVSIFQEYIFGYIRNRLGYDLRMALFDKLSEKDILFFHKKNVGELMSRIFQEVRDVLSLFSTTLIRLVTEIVSFVATIAIMFSLNWQLALIVCFSIPLVVIGLKYFNPKFQKGNREIMENYAQASNVLQENLQGISILKYFRKERYGVLRFSKSLHTLINSQMKMVYFGILNGQFMSYVYAIAPTALIVFGGKLVIEGIMTIGSFTAFYSYLGRLYGPVRSLAHLNIELQRTLTAFNRYYELLHDFDESGDEGERVLLDKINNEIELKGITFAYNEEQDKLLDDFSLTLKPGQMIGIVGRNGIGKSTLFGLVTDQYKPMEGKVSIDSIPIGSLKRKSLQQLFGVVPQETYLFNLSIMDNIKLGRRDLSFKKIDELAEMLNIRDFIESLPEGYDTIAEKSGENFSGGQRQKIGIIRAMAADPQVILLDEATSAIDVETEEEFFEWLAKNKKDKIILFISHKPHLLRYADKIIRFEGVNEIAIEESCEMIS
ncbi:MAG: ABC transporter ATP-binding protein [Halanaerobiales bacterium]|nr:ABC transporter ATP-binding protein [Halanaerobiales bacterium]